MSQKNKDDRLALCEAIKDRLPYHMKSTLFFDEAPARKHTKANKQTMRVRCEPEDRPYNLKTRSGVTVNYAAGICYYGVTDLWIEKDGELRWDKFYYAKVLKWIKKQGDKLYANTQFKNTWRIVEDRCPTHTSGVANDMRVELGIRCLAPASKPGDWLWGGNSPDLNCIENMFSIMKDQVYLENPPNKEALIKCMRKSWKKIAKEGHHKKNGRIFSKKN